MGLGHPVIPALKKRRSPDSAPPRRASAPSVGVILAAFTALWLPAPAQAFPPVCIEFGFSEQNSFLIMGTDGPDFLEGADKQEFESRDTIFGAPGNDQMDGRRGNDCLVGDEGLDTAIGNTGSDVIFGNTETDLLSGRDGNDRIFGGPGNEATDQGGGLAGGKGKDQLFGESGNDELSGGPKGDTLVGGNDNDLLNGGEGDDTLDDSLRFADNPGQNRFIGGPEDDEIDAVNGRLDKKIDGGPGFDECAVDDNDTKIRNCEIVRECEAKPTPGKPANRDCKKLRRETARRIR